MKFLAFSQTKLGSLFDKTRARVGGACIFLIKNTADFIGGIFYLVDYCIENLNPFIQEIKKWQLAIPVLVTK